MSKLLSFNHKNEGKNNKKEYLIFFCVFNCRFHRIFCQSRFFFLNTSCTNLSKVLLIGLYGKTNSKIYLEINVFDQVFLLSPITIGKILDLHDLDDCANLGSNP